MLSTQNLERQIRKEAEMMHHTGRISVGMLVALYTAVVPYCLSASDVEGTCVQGIWAKPCCRGTTTAHLVQLLAMLQVEKYRAER